jgi:hypothetical protein
MRSCYSAGSGDITGVLRYLRLAQHDIQFHKPSSPPLFHYIISFAKMQVFYEKSMGWGEKAMGNSGLGMEKAP